jgi:diguanylate cyclase (GGDEF)-like protein
VDENQLAEIESRIATYPPQAQSDILALAAELRRVRQAGVRKKQEPDKGHLYDPLTGLLNIGAYGVRFAMARARATRFKKMFAVMSIDVGMPDSAAEQAPGSAVDETIRHVARRLEACVRATDTLARIGERNFAIILEDLTQPGHAERVKQHVQEVLGEAVDVGGDRLTPEVGIAMEFYPGPSEDAPTRVYHS